MAQSRRKRKRAKARGDRPETRDSARGVGELRADWTRISVEDAALIRQAVRGKWPVGVGAAILAALTSAIDPPERPRQVNRVVPLLLEIDRRNLGGG